MATALQLPSKTVWRTVNLLNDWPDLQPTWDKYVLDHPKGSIFHTSEMIRVFQAAKGHAPLALAAVQPDGEITALLVAVRVQTLPDPLGRVSSRSILYAEPLCRDDSNSVDALASLVAQHDAFMRRTTLFTEVRPLLGPGPERIALERCGYQFLDYLNYIVDISPPPDSILNGLRRDARQSLRKCEKAGYQTREIRTSDGIDPLYRLLTLSYGNANVPLAHRSLFEAAFKILHPKGALKLAGTYLGDAPVAMHVNLIYKDLVFAWYAGTERVPRYSPLDQLKWSAFVSSHLQGFLRYDFGGAGWPDEAYGVRDYKAKFGGDLVCYGRYRKVYSEWKMKLAKRAYEFGRTIISPKARK